MRIRVFGWFGYKNLGDDLLLDILVEQLLSIDERVTVLIQAHDSLYLEGRFPKARASFARRSVLELLTGEMDEALIIGPGGLFPHRSSLKVFAFSKIVNRWKNGGNAVVIYLVGANAQVGSLGRLSWQSISSKSDLFAMRDDDLFKSEIVKDDKSKCFSAADAIFTLDRDDFFSSRTDGGMKKIAVSFANLFDVDERGYEGFLATCTEVVGDIVAHGYNVDLLTFTDERDSRLNCDIASCFTKKVKVLSYEETRSAIHSIKNYDAMVGMRFHAIALSIFAGIPVIPISYSQKTEHLMTRCGMKDHLVFYCKSSSEYYGRLIPLDGKAIQNELSALLENPSAFMAEQDVIDSLHTDALKARNALKDVLLSMLD